MEDNIYVLKFTLLIDYDPDWFFICGKKNLDNQFYYYRFKSTILHFHHLKIETDHVEYVS